MGKYLNKAVEQFQEIISKIDYYDEVIWDYEVKEFLENVIKEAEARVMARLKAALKEDDGDEI